MSHYGVPKLLFDMPKSVGGWALSRAPLDEEFYSAPPDLLSGPKRPTEPRLTVAGMGIDPPP